MPPNAQTIWRNLIPPNMPRVMLWFLRFRLPSIQWHPVYFLFSETALIFINIRTFGDDIIYCCSVHHNKYAPIVDVQLNDSFMVKL